MESGEFLTFPHIFILHNSFCWFYKYTLYIIDKIRCAFLKHHIFLIHKTHIPTIIHILKDVGMWKTPFNRYQDSFFMWKTKNYTVFCVFSMWINVE